MAQRASAVQVVDWVNSRLPRRADVEGSAAAFPASAPGTAPAAAEAQGSREPQNASGPTPEEIATDEALRSPPHLVEGVDFSYYSPIPAVVYEESLARLAGADPALLRQIQRASQSMQAGQFGDAALAPEGPDPADAVGPLTG